MSERPMMLDDRWWVSGAKLNPAVERRIQAARPLARRYLLGAEASAHVGGLLRVATDLVVENREFARAPFPVTYIEVDISVLWRAWRPDHAQSENHDKRVGYLVDGDRVFVFASSGGRPGLGLFHFTFSGRTSDVLAARVTDEQVNALYHVYALGGGRTVDSRGRISAIHVPLDPTERERFVRPLEVGYTLDPSVMDRMSTSRVVDALFQSGGDPLLLTAVLLLITRPRAGVLGFSDVPRRRGLARGGRPAVFAAHTVVTVHLSPGEPHHRMIHIGDRASPRLHDVAGHWVHRNKTGSCEHSFEALDLEHQRYRCARCGMRRTWRKSFVRGDASRGVSTKHYEVVP